MIAHDGEDSMANDLTPRKAADDFHMMIGYCVAEWAKVDDELFRIFRDCVGPYEQSAIIYYRTPTLNARLGLTDEIVQSVLPKRKKKSGGHYHPSVKAWKVAIEGFCNPGNPSPNRASSNFHSPWGILAKLGFKLDSRTAVLVRDLRRSTRTAKIGRITRFEDG